MNLTIVFITARPRPRVDWLFDSLALCGGREHVGQIVIIDQFAQAYGSWSESDVAARRNSVYNAAKSFIAFNPECSIDWQPPKPNVWAGKYRLTPRDWWNKPVAINTGACYCKNDYIAFIDDRCVLSNTSIDAIREAVQKQYAVCGTYSKHWNMAVTDGLIASTGELKGEDSRASVVNGSKMMCPGVWMFGHAIAMPLEWLLNINGSDESWCSVSMEDTHLGQLLENNGYPIYHDPRWKTTQDRTPNQCEYDMKRSSKEKHPNDKTDKTHKLIEKLWKNKLADNPFSLRDMRRLVLGGGVFPTPNGPTEDWFDGQKLNEMT